MAKKTDALQYIKGVGEKRANLLGKLGLSSVDTLLRFYPRKYLDFANTTPIFDAVLDETVCIKAQIVSDITEEHYKSRKITVYKFRIKDSSGEALVKLYNVTYLASSLKRGWTYLFYGKITGNLFEREMSSPIIKNVNESGFNAVYPLTVGITSHQISNIVKNAIEATPLEDTLPDWIREKYGLCGLKEGLYKIHFPKSKEDIITSRKRFAFEELFMLQAAFALIKAKNAIASPVCVEKDYSNEFFEFLPFEPTNAQKRVTEECVTDMLNNRALNRLIQGDVGSGKTAVAAALCYTIIKNGYQAAVMAPTEILAEQHFITLSNFLSACKINCELLTGSLTAKKKSLIKQRLKEGEIDIIVGTHALITDDVEFKNLGLVITDEQHRFGVEQRSKLSNKGNSPHRIVMSATPIPRTLAMIIYGELDVSIIDEYPKNRQTIETYAVDKSYRERIYNFIKKHIEKGQQAYIVCPLVEENESDLVSAEEYYKDLRKNAFLNYKVGLLHGKQRPAEKEKVMRSFKNKEIVLLICTTVVEVGIDVPNATVMVIENAERFGLASLHQLRGRIGRGVNKSTCILISEKFDNERLSIMCSTTDGFKIADEDLKLRGPGDFIGKRQHGLPEMKIADLSSDMDLMRTCGIAVKELLLDDPDLIKPQHKELKAEIESIIKNSFTV